MGACGCVRECVRACVRACVRVCYVVSCCCRSERHSRLGTGFTGVVTQRLPNLRVRGIHSLKIHNIRKLRERLLRILRVLGIHSRRVCGIQSPRVRRIHSLRVRRIHSPRVVRSTAIRYGVFLYVCGDCLITIDLIWAEFVMMGVRVNTTELGLLYENPASPSTDTLSS